MGSNDDFEKKGFTMKKVLQLLSLIAFAGLASLQATPPIEIGDYRMTYDVFEPDTSEGPPNDVIFNVIPITDGDGTQPDSVFPYIDPYAENTEGLIYIYNITHIPSGNTLHIEKQGRWFTINHGLAFEVIHNESGDADGIGYELSVLLYGDLYPNNNKSRFDYVDLTSNYFEMVDALGVFMEAANHFGSASFYQGMDNFIRQLDTRKSCGGMWGHLPDLEWDQLHKAVKLLGSGTADGAFINTLYLHEAMTLHPCID